MVKLNKLPLYQLSHFVPKHQPCSEQLLSKLQSFVDDHKRLFILTGAGISTESGIPDYRSEGVGLYATSDKRPVQFKVCFTSYESGLRLILYNLF